MVADKYFVAETSDRDKEKGLNISRIITKITLTKRKKCAGVERVMYSINCYHNMQKLNLHRPTNPLQLQGVGQVLEKYVV